MVVLLAACAVPLSRAADCNSNGLDDAEDVTANRSHDCNDTGLPDECELFRTVTLTSGELTPVAGGEVLSLVLAESPPALGDVTVTVSAFADLSAAEEFLEVTLNGTFVGTLFESGGSDCPETPDEDELTIPRVTFNAQTVGTNALLEIAPTSAVDNACPSSSHLRITVTYRVFQDCNGDGIPDECATDCNANAAPDDCDLAAGTSPDCNDNAIPDECETDCNGNGVPDDCDLATETSPDCDANDIPDECDLADGAADCNANGVPDACEVASGATRDCDTDGVPDECQTGLANLAVAFRQPPTETTGIYADADCKHCEIPGAQSAAAGFEVSERTVVGVVRLWGGYFPGNDATSGDRFSVIFHDFDSSLPGAAVASFANVALTRARTGVTLSPAVDEWVYELTLPRPVALAPGSYFLEIFNDTTGGADTFFWELGSSVAAGSIAGAPFAKETPGEAWLLDAATNLAFELVAGTQMDCDTNGLLDACELAAGSARDCNSNSLIDLCEPGCSSNGVPDECLIAAGTSTDCDNNGVPDDCDLANGGADCDGNGALDACDIAFGNAPDCDRNGVPDGCDLAGGATDCDTNGVPDVCDPDADGNGTIDACEPSDGDGDGVPDANDLCPNTPSDSTVDEAGCAILELPIGLGCGAGALGSPLLAGLFFGGVRARRRYRAGRRNRDAASGSGR